MYPDIRLLTPSGYPKYKITIRCSPNYMVCKYNLLLDSCIGGCRPGQARAVPGWKYRNHPRFDYSWQLSSFVNRKRLIFTLNC